MNNLTAIIKTFLRDEYLYKCIKSLAKNYPKVQILVGDGGHHSKEKKNFVEAHGGKYIKLPFDCGIPYGRNRLIELVKTDYILVGDDDFYYTQGANLQDMMKLTDIADIVGGRVKENGNIRNYQGFIDHAGNQLIFKRLLLDNWENYEGLRYKPCDLVFNFFIASTKVVKDIKWDENIKVAFEHADFFLTSKERGYKTIFTPHGIVDHKPDVNIPEYREEEYRKYRNRREDKEYFYKKRNLESAIDINGFMDKL